MSTTKTFCMSEAKIQELRRQRRDLAGSVYSEGFQAGRGYATREGDDGATLEEFLWFERNAPTCTDWRLAVAQEQHRITDHYGEPERFPADFWRGFAEGVLAVWRQHREDAMNDG